MAGDQGTGHIIQSLVVNLVIAVAKVIAAVITGSGSLLAEAIHSFADCGNQLLLLLGVRQAKRPASASHPLGYGRSLYFWSFMVALLIFTGGGVFSIYEGVHKMRHPEPIERAYLGYAILGFSLLLEGFATWGNLREMKKRRGSMRLIPYLRATKDSDLVVVFGENLAAVIGLAFALVALLLSQVTGDTRWDGAGSLCIGVVLVAVAVFLATEVKSLLVGESADPDIEAAVKATVAESPAMGQLLTVITVQQGPGEVMVALKVRPDAGQDVDTLIAEINAFERALKQRAPEVRWLFVEPDDHA